MEATENPGSEAPVFVAPEVIYNGTSAGRAKLALEVGLRTRTKHEKTKGAKFPDLVRLTTSYPAYFSMAYTTTEWWGIVELDFSKLDNLRLAPDEDFLMAAYQSVFQVSGLQSPDQQRMMARASLPHTQKFWKESLYRLGNISHHGDIPKEAVKRVCVFDPASNPEIALLAADPILTIPNHTMCGDKYNLLARWFFGEEIDPKEIAMLVPTKDQIPESVEDVYTLFAKISEDFESQVEIMEEVLSKRDGIRVLEPRRPCKS